MKRLILGAAACLLLLLSTTGCTNVLHNGTQMVVQSVTVTGLPSNPFAPGTQLAFSYNINNTNVWVHDTVANLTNSQWMSTVAANGSWTHTFTTPLVITSSQLTFLLIDPTQNWSVYQVDNRIISGTSYNNVVLNNTWGGSSSPVSIVGTVKGNDVTWTIQ